MSRRTGLRLAEVVVPLAVVAAVWGWTLHIDVYYYPPLGEILASFADTWLFERFGSDVVPSLVRLGAGYLAAVAAGIVLGTALGQSRALRRSLQPVVEFLRAIPAPALIPFAILVLGVGNLSKVFLIAFVCVWPVLLNTIDGVSGVDPTLLDTSRAYRIPRADHLRFVVLPAAAPQILTGMRVSLALALLLVVVSEMVASADGIGYFVLQAQRSFAIREMWSGILLLGLLGYAFNGAFLLAEGRLLAWHRGLHARRSE